MVIIATVMVATIETPTTGATMATVIIVEVDMVVEDHQPITHGIVDDPTNGEVPEVDLIMVQDLPGGPQEGMMIATLRTSTIMIPKVLQATQVHHVVQAAVGVLLQATILLLKPKTMT
mmetsp:Transcript_26055/g.21473  ORF Transcript_26055/g.21473 Transcript_26055/m.21473 type:complete len:118 (-) Transcript_26055:4-357(-)